MKSAEKKTYLVMIFIVILGTILRLIFIDKPDGLWNDEYVSWSIASIPLSKNFISAVFAQCHMPFYYLYLKFFIHFLGNSDLMLRLTSVIPGILSIFSMYYVGKEFKDEKLGILCAALTAISSFLIYFSQEVRFYGLLFLFASLSFLFTLRLVKTRNLFNILFYIVSNLLIIFTHTIGFIFVLFNLIFITLYSGRNEKNKKPNIMIWSSIFLFSLIGLPLIFKIFTTHSQAQWWGHFTVSKLGFLVTDYFSPILTNIVSAPDNFFYNFNLWFIIFAIIPSSIAIAGGTRALITKEYRVLGLFYVCFAYILILILASLSGKLVFITKYSIEVYPTLIFLMAFGLLEFEKRWRYILIFSFCFLNLFYLLANPMSAPKLHRSEGHKIVANLIKNANLNNGDYILLNYYPKARFEKYFNFDKYNVISIDKGNFSQFTGINSKADFGKINDKYFEKEFRKEILSKLKHNQKITVIILNDVVVYSPLQLQLIQSDKKEYDKAPFLFLVFSYIKNQILKDSLENLSILRIEQKGSWTAVTFLKR